MSKTFRSKKGGEWNFLDSFNSVNKKHQDENQKISGEKKQPNEEEKKGNQAEGDKLEGTEKEKKPEKEPKGDKEKEEEEEEKNKGKTLEEDKVDKIYPRDLNIIGGNNPRQWKPLDKR
ncbi:hypothetical protein Pint_09581 [Pistacia integerrima]|uniref:Uncharacterized protein n=1 Tax=Pistacia integerrima TaxID=434235 RepID=A0ACC0XF06_9ROSI|nr:hypothetical protein Pint_09581 [Pistacia integerrima]